MSLLPRTNGPIFNTGILFTPEQFPLGWNLTMEWIETNLGLSTSGGFDPSLWGCGRVATLDYFAGDAAKITLPDSPALALKLPAAIYYVADAEGAMHRLDAQVRLVTDVPALLDAKYGYLRVYEVEDGDGALDLEVFGWTGTLDASKIAAGYPCVGVVSSDSDSVSEVVSAEATVIWPQPLLQAVLRNLLGAANNGGGGGGGTGYNALNQLPVEVGSTTDSKTYVDDLVSDINTKLEALQDVANIFPAPFDILADEIALNRAGIAEVNPPSIERGQISVVVKNAGHGQNDTPDFAPNSPTTNDPLELPWDAVQGVFGP